MIKKLTGLTASLAALVSTASAAVTINDNLSIEGYVAASATVTDPDAGPSNETAFDSGLNNLDSAYVAFLGTYGDFSGKASLFYVPGANGGENSDILDLYASYTAGSITVTGGKYLSYLGYEAFHAGSMAQLTYGLASGIPAYRTGIKGDFAVSETLSLGVSVTDSFLSKGALLSEGATYTGIEKLTVFVGLGVDDDDATVVGDYVFDIWASYAVTDALTLAAEFSYEDDVDTSYLLFAQYAFSEKFSSVFRWSFQEADATGEYTTYLTVAPAYALTENLTVRAEVSYGDSGAAPFGKGYGYGVQGVFKF
jgi:Putative beta-barrel porin-2, OmpL-like. bbp2